MTGAESGADADPVSNRNNPYHKTAQSYEKKLNSPFVRPFRRAEEQKLRAVFDRLIKPEDVVLEIGCGTGYYTRYLIDRAAKVVALDDSEKMLRLTRGRLPEADQDRIELVHSEATRYLPDEPFDVVVHIGVLDYVKQWEAFLAHSLTHAKRAVIFTCPTTGLFGQVFHLTARFEGSRIQRFHRKQLEGFIRDRHPGWSVEMEMVGPLHRVRGAMTWVAVITRDRGSN